MRRGKRWVISLAGLFMALVLARNDASAASPPWGNRMPSVRPHIVVLHGTKSLRCWTDDNRRWFCWNQDTVFEGHLEVDPMDPRRANLLHFAPDGGLACRYDAVSAQTGGRSGWLGTSRCVGRGGTAVSGNVSVEFDQAPVAVVVPPLPPPPPPPPPRDGSVNAWASGALNVRIEGFRVTQGPPGAVLRCDWSTILTNTGSETVIVDSVLMAQAIPARPGPEFNRDVSFGIGVTLRPGESVVRPGDMGFTSSAAGIEDLVRKGGIRWQGVRYQARAQSRQTGSWRNAPVTTAFSRIDCPGGPG